MLDGGPVTILNNDVYQVIRNLFSSFLLDLKVIRQNLTIITTQLTALPYNTSEASSRLISQVLFQEYIL